MIDNLQHFIITNNNYSPSYPHLEDRIKMIQKYTIPSVCNQINKNFIWLLSGNLGISKEVIKDINYLIVKKPIEYIKEYAKHNRNIQYIATSRLDNDDYILPGYIESLQNNFKSCISNSQVNLDFLIDIAGFRADLRYNKMYIDKLYHKGASPFLSTLESTDKELKLGWYTKHGDMYNHFNNIVRIQHPQWVQIIHKTNKLMNKTSERGIAAQGSYIGTTTNIDKQYDSILEHFKSIID